MKRIPCSKRSPFRLIRGGVFSVCVLAAFGIHSRAALIGESVPAIRNSGFEEIGPDGKTPLHWVFHRAAGAEWATDATTAHTGERSARVTGIDPGKQDRYVRAWRQDVPFEVNAPYFLSVWVKAKDVTTGRVAVLIRDGTGAVTLNQTLAAFAGTFDWREFSGVIRQVPGTRSLQLVLGLVKSGGTAWLDDVRLIPAETFLRGYGAFAVAVRKTPVAGTLVPVDFRFTVGERGLAPGGTLALRWERWRPAREFRIRDVEAICPVEGVSFSILYPPRETTWPPEPRPIACVATLQGDRPLDAGTEVALRARVRFSRHTNVISRLVGELSPGPTSRALAFQPPVALRAVGGRPARLLCTAEARPLAGRPGRLTVAVVDANGNPCADFVGTVALAASTGCDLPPSHAFLATDRGSRTFAVTAPAGVVTRFSASFDGLEAVSNPVLPRSVDEPGIFFGDIHSHCEISGDGVGDPDLGYEYARRFFGLDFAALSDHSPRGVRWEELTAAARRHNAPGQFVTISGYEWSNTVGGHRNIYYPDLAGPGFAPGIENNTTAWWNRLAKRDIRALIIPHHTNTEATQIKANGRPAWGPADWSAVNHTYQRLVEICQNRGSFEVPGGPIKELRVMRADRGASVQTALAKGHRLGFIGSTDTHSGRPGNGAARCVILSLELARGSLWHALHDRRCYATTGAHILVFLSLNGHPMGSVLPAGSLGGPRRLAWRVVGTGPVRRVDLLRRNRVVKSWSGGGKDDLSAAFRFAPPLDGREWWYVRVLQEDTQIAWSSPIWILGEDSLEADRK